MTIALLLALAELALVDSTSFGALEILVVLVVSARKVDVRLMAVYFGTVAGFYFAIGLVLMFGLSTAISTLGGALDSSPAHWVQLVLGVGMFAINFRFDGKRKGDKPR